MPSFLDIFDGLHLPLAIASVVHSPTGFYTLGSYQPHILRGISLPLPLPSVAHHSPTASEPLNANEPYTQVAAPKPVFIATAFHHHTEENWAPDST